MDKSERGYKVIMRTLTEYQITRDKQRRQIMPSIVYDCDNFVSLLAYQDMTENELNTDEEALKCSFPSRRIRW